MNMRILNLVVGMGLSAGLMASAAPYEQTVRLSESTRLYPGDKLCIGRSFQQATRYDLSQVGNVQLKIRAESVKDRNYNQLYVTDGYGRSLRVSGDSNIPYTTGNMFVSIEEQAQDVCLQASKEARLSDIEVTYAPYGGGYTPGPNPGYPPNPPGPQYPNPPMPPPNGPNFGSIIGEIKTITDNGVVYGWGCNTNSRASLRLSVYVNGRMDRSLNVEANQNIRQEPAMGLPDRQCGEYSGFKFQLSNSERFDGSFMDVEVRGLDERGNGETVVGRRSFKTPVRFVGKSLFKVGTSVYFSNGENAYCHIPTADQHRLFNLDGLRTIDLKELPAGMRNDGTCQARPFPKGFFQARVAPGTVFFSTGRTFCGVPLAGMLYHIAAKEKISRQNTENQEQYDNLPVAGSMQNIGICMVEGQFQVGNEVYYGNGTNAYCRIKTAAPGENTGAFPYEITPPNLAFHGDCK